MSIQELTSKVKDYRELKRMAEELDAEIDTLADEIKAAMGDQEQVTAGEYKITWKTIASSRVDAIALRREMPELAERFTKTTTTRRFTVS